MPLRLAPKLEYFPAWHVDVNGHPATAVSAEDTAQLLVPLPAGTYQVDIHLAHTWDRTAGGWISILAAALALILYGRSAPRLSGSATTSTNSS